MRVLFFFLDGVGLGQDDPVNNPLARADMPNLRSLLNGRRLVRGAASLETERATLVALDACMGVRGHPQSATGQAALLTGHNVSATLGYHFGPWPNTRIVELLTEDNLFGAAQVNGQPAALLNAYPEGYFAAINSGYRSYSAIPKAAVSAGLTLKTTDDLMAGRALSTDFTGQAWRERLNIPGTPLLTHRDAGRRMAQLATEHAFTFFEYWPSDYAGHRQDMAESTGLLKALDEVLGGLLAAWQDDAGLILVTSDHGNLEDLSTRGHTRNPVPALLIGAPDLRRAFAASLHDLTDVAPAIHRLLRGCFESYVNKIA